MKRASFATALLASLLLVACGGGSRNAPPAAAPEPAPVAEPEPVAAAPVTRDDCARLMDHIFGVMQADPNTPDEEKEMARMIQEQLASGDKQEELDAFLEECAGSLSRAEFDCAMTAQSREAIEACGQ
jgi:hypothetical protein